MPISTFTARFAGAFAVTSAALLLSAPAGAQGAGGYYDATPVAMPTKASLVTGETIWKCQAGVCSAHKAPSRDGIVCEQVAKRVGALTAFSANGTAFDAPALAKCNARAR